MCSDTLATIKRGTYLNRKFRKDVLHQINETTPLRVVHYVKRVLEEQGFTFDDKLDNKSVSKPEDLFTALERYVAPVPFNPDWQVFDAAVNDAWKAFARPADVPRLDALGILDSSELVKAMKSSGAPNFIRKGNDVFHAMQLAYRILQQGRTPDPCVSYRRVQHGESGPKTRLVWGFPLSMLLIEGCYAPVLISNFLSRRNPMMFGMSKGCVSASLSTINNCRYQYGFDFSKFDASIKPKLIAKAFEILRSWFGGEKTDRWDRIENYFVFTPIVMPDGNIYVKERGVPSGSWFTQMIDSIVNYIAIQYAHRRMFGHPLSPRKIAVLGDDSLIGSDYRIDEARFAAVVRELGLTMNPEKTSKGHRGSGYHFLGHEWRQSLPHRSEWETAIRMVYPERYFNLPDNCNFAQERIGAYLTDSPEAWTMFRRAMGWCGRTPIIAFAIAHERRLLITGWELYVYAVFNDPALVIGHRSMVLGSFL